MPSWPFERPGRPEATAHLDLPRLGHLGGSLVHPVRQGAQQRRHLRAVPHGAADFIERYRTKEEIQEWRKRDPIGLLEQKILDAGAADEDQINAIEKEAKAIVDEAVKFAEESPEPSLDELTTDVYVD